MSRVAPARAAAFDVLLTLERGSSHSDELLYQPTISKLSPQDRNLATNLIMGSLRWQLALDARVAGLLNYPQRKLDPAVRIALRLGAFQLVYLDRVPVYAAIGESVELAKAADNKFATRMVNAVLRKIADQPKTKEIPKAASSGELASYYAHPQWLVDRWVENFGMQPAAKICEYDQQPAPVFVRLIESDAEQALLQEGIELAPASFLSNVRNVVKGDVSSTAAFRDGLVRIQDEASQLVAEIAGHGKQILDACAAPGGKTAILAQRNPNASIVACDISKKRLNAMQSMLWSSGNIDFRLADVATLELKPEYDLVLCDAPCSGTGTLARNPEIRHRLKQEELSRQHERQVSILSSVMRGVRIGGRLIYSTCSLEPEENEAVVHECLDRFKEYKLIPIDQEVKRLEHEGVMTQEGAEKLRVTAMKDGYLRTLPGLNACDGFFAALFGRRN